MPDELCYPNIPAIRGRCRSRSFSRCLCMAKMVGRVLVPEDCSACIAKLEPAIHASAMPIRQMRAQLLFTVPRLQDSPVTEVEVRIAYYFSCPSNLRNDIMMAYPGGSSPRPSCANHIFTKSRRGDTTRHGGHELPGLSAFFSCPFDPDDKKVQAAMSSASLRSLVGHTLHLLIASAPLATQAYDPSQRSCVGDNVCLTSFHWCAAGDGREDG